MLPDPALDLTIQPPAPYWRRRLLLLAPLLTWLVALGSAGAWLWRAPAKLLPVLSGFICTGIALLAVALPTAWTSLRGSLASLRLARPARDAVAMLSRGDAAGAEGLLRACLADPHLNPPSLAVLIHNLGVARLAQGDVSTARALMAHARASGWLMSWRLRRHRAIYAQGYVMVCVATGAFDEARQALQDARGAIRRGQGPPVDLAALILHAMAGDHDETLRIATALPFDALGPDLARLGRLVAAYAAAQRGEDPNAWISGEDLRAPLDKHWLVRSWPALHAFTTALRQEAGADTEPVE